MQVCSTTMVELIDEYADKVDSGGNGTAVFSSLKAVLLKVDRLVDICNGTIKNKKGVKKGCENIDRPDHPLLKEALEVLVMFAEWKKEAGKETSAFITNQSYEDLCWLVCCLVGVSQTYLRPDQKKHSSTAPSRNR
jgi:hypothetical protein